MEFGGKIILFQLLAWDKEHRGGTCAQRQPSLWPLPCSDTGREEEVMPTIVHHIDTLKKKMGIVSVGGGFLRPQRSEGRVEQECWCQSSAVLRLQVFQVLRQRVLLDVFLNVPASQVSFQVLLYHKVQGCLRESTDGLQTAHAAPKTGSCARGLGEHSFSLHSAMGSPVQAEES